MASRASCRIDLTRRAMCDFEVNNDKYMAFIRPATAASPSGGSRPA